MFRALANCSLLDHWLHGEYWKHIEYFPMHNYRVLDSNPDVRAMDVLRCGMVGMCHATLMIPSVQIALDSYTMADHMTSPTSTFPLTAADCGIQMDALRSSKRK